MKNFKTGDRVYIVSLKDTGVIIWIEYDKGATDAGAATLLIDPPKQFMPIEKIKFAKTKPSDVVKYHTFVSDLQHLKTPKGSDWKDIWDQNE